jgi:hypothetical protein
MKKQVKKPDRAEAGDRQQELAELISQASKQPGVEQLMQVYQQWKPFEEVMRVHRQYLGIQRIVFVSNSSSGNMPRSR